MSFPKHERDQIERMNASMQAMGQGEESGQCRGCGRSWSVRFGECIRCQWKVGDPVESCPKCETDLAGLTAKLARLAQFEALAKRAAEHGGSACEAVICGTCAGINGDLAALAEETA